MCGFEGNIDQVQYCDKIKNIVDFLGTHLSDEELMKIWKMQVCETRVILMVWYGIVGFNVPIDAESRHLHVADSDVG